MDGWNEIRIVNGKQKANTMSNTKKKKAPKSPAKITVTPSRAHNPPASTYKKKKKKETGQKSAPAKVQTKTRHMRKPNPGKTMQQESGTILLFGGAGVATGFVGGQLFNRVAPSWSNGARSAVKGAVAGALMLAAAYWKPMQSVEAIAGAAGLSFGLSTSVLLDQFADRLGLIPAPADMPDEMSGPDDEGDDEEEIDGADFDAMVRRSMGSAATDSMQGLGDALRMDGLGDRRPAPDVMGALPGMQGHRGGMGDLVSSATVPVPTGNNNMQGRRPRKYGMGAPN